MNRIYGKKGLFYTIGLGENHADEIFGRAGKQNIHLDNSLIVDFYGGCGGIVMLNGMPKIIKGHDKESIKRMKNGNMSPNVKQY